MPIMQDSGSSSDGSESGNMKNLKDSLLSGRNGRAGEIFLTESSKSLVSIAQSNKQWVGTCLKIIISKAGK